jgi:hypothetical protein
MCSFVRIGKKCFETVGELAAELGEIVHIDEPSAPEYCLCGVDKRATAEKHGYILGTNDFDFYFLKSGEPLPKNVRLSDCPITE